MRTPASARMCAESQICTAFALIGTRPTLVQNGGSARGYQKNLRDVGGPADLRSAQHAAAWPEYLCRAVLHGECALLPLSGC